MNFTVERSINRTRKVFDANGAIVADFVDSAMGNMVYDFFVEGVLANRHKLFDQDSGQYVVGSVEDLSRSIEEE